MSFNILIVEDNEDILNLLELYLKGENYNVFKASNGALGLDVINSNSIDLSIIDLMMPVMDGYTLLRKIREFSTMPVLILTAKVEDNDKIIGLNLGADDYITKPFNALEVVARVKCNLRRSYDLNNSQKKTSLLTIGDLCLDTDKIELYKGDESIIITATEFKILVLLINKRGSIFSKMQIALHLNGQFFSSDENTITVHISHLREKIGNNLNGNPYIKTVRGLGYKIDEK